MGKESAAYLIAYFRSGPMQTNKREKLHYAYSHDGLHWYELNQNNSVWSPSIGEGILRDPFINRGKDGKWHMVFTIRPKGKMLGYACSKDLITWEEEKIIDVMTNYDETQNSWAPEFNYDPVNDDYLLYWASSVGNKMSNNKHYYSRTKDWITFTKSKLLFDPGFQTIDASITQWDGKNYMFVKDESNVYDQENHPHPPANKLAISSKLEGPYEVISDFITPDYTEGPEILKLYNQEKWYLFYDYWKYGRFGIKESTNLVDWSEELERGMYRFPHQMRHATVFSLNEDELMNLINHYSLEVHYPTTFHGHVSLAKYSTSEILHNEFCMRSVSLWFKSHDLSGTQVLYDEGGNKDGLCIHVRDGLLEAATRNLGNQVTVTAGLVESKKWHNVVVVFNEGNLNIYLDGNLFDSKNAKYQIVERHSMPGGLGSRFGDDAFGESGSKGEFDGLIRDVRIYTVPLQDADVRYLFKMDK